MNSYKKEIGFEIPNESNSKEDDYENKTQMIYQQISLILNSNSNEQTISLLSDLNNILLLDKTLKIQGKNWNFCEILQKIIISLYNYDFNWVIALDALINWQFVMIDDNYITLDFFDFICNLLMEENHGETSMDIELFETLICFIDNTIIDNPDIINVFSDNYEDFLVYLTDKYYITDICSIKYAITSIFEAISTNFETNPEISLRYLDLVVETGTISNEKSLQLFISLLEYPNFLESFSKTDLFMKITKSLVYIDRFIPFMIDAVNIMMKSNNDAALLLIREFDPVYSLLYAKSSDSTFPKAEYFSMCRKYIRILSDFKIQFLFLKFFQESFTENLIQYKVQNKMIKLLNEILDFYQNSQENIQLIVNYEMIHKIIDLIDPNHLEISKICIDILYKLVIVGCNINPFVKCEISLNIDLKNADYLDFKLFANILDSEEFDSIMGELGNEIDDEKFVEETNQLHEKCNEMINKYHQLEMQGIYMEYSEEEEYDFESFTVI